MGRPRARKLMCARAIHARYGQVNKPLAEPSEQTRARKDEVRARKTSACLGCLFYAPSQAAELQRRWRIATLLDHHDGDDDDLISSTNNDALPRAGFVN